MFTFMLTHTAGFNLTSVFLMKSGMNTCLISFSVRYCECFVMYLLLVIFFMHIEGVFLRSGEEKLK